MERMRRDRIEWRQTMDSSNMAAALAAQYAARRVIDALPGRALTLFVGLYMTTVNYWVGDNMGVATLHYNADAEAIDSFLIEVERAVETADKA